MIDRKSKIFISVYWNVLKKLFVLTVRIDHFRYFNLHHLATKSDKSTI